MHLTQRRPSLVLVCSSLAALALSACTTLEEPLAGGDPAEEGVGRSALFGPWEERVPLAQEVQNYLVESVLSGAYEHAPRGFERERRGDGLATRGLSRFVGPVRVCVHYGVSAVRAALEAEIADAVTILTDEGLTTTNEGCVDFPPIDPCSSQCSDLPDEVARQVNVFLGCGNHGEACYEGGLRGHVEGAAITGGLLQLYNLDQQTLRHELGHVFGLKHTWGEPDIMSYRLRTPDYAAFEREAFSVVYQLEPGLGLRDLIALGVIEDSPAVLREPPTIVRTEIIRPELLPVTDLSGDPVDFDHAAVGQSIYLRGQRLTLPLGADYLEARRPNGWAPPIVRYGGLPLVADLRRETQYSTIQWRGAPTGILRVYVPPGAGDGLTLERYDGEVVALPGFTVDLGPLPPGTPNPITDLTCERRWDPHGYHLAWTLPATLADGSPFDPTEATAVVRRNGVEVATLGPAVGDYVDPGVYPDYEASLYQVTLIGGAGEAGIPSDVCRIEPHEVDKEVSYLLIDRSAAMGELRADGTTRFEEVLGPLDPPRIPRAHAALDELFAPGRTTPIIRILSFGDGIFHDELFDLFGTVQTSDPAIAAAALEHLRSRGTAGGADLFDNLCWTAHGLFYYTQTGGERATLRLFTAGLDTGSTGEPCGASCVATGSPPEVPWDTACRPGVCRASSTVLDEPTDCTDCQLDLFDEACGPPPAVIYFVEYFGPEGPRSPLPPNAGILHDLAQETGGLFVHNADTGEQAVARFVSNLPPLADAGEDQVIWTCGADEWATVQLQPSVWDEEPTDALTFRWAGPFGEGDVVEGPHPVVTLPPGSHLIELTVADEHQRSEPSTVQIEVVPRDGEAPTLSATASPAELWPPNHRLVPVTVALEVGDDCDGEVVVRLVSVTSSEPDDGSGDGHHAPDIAGADLGTDDRQVQLRAERSGGGEGRVYTLVYEARDDAGNLAEAQVLVRVPHDRR